MVKKLLFITPMFPVNESEDIVVPFITHFTERFAETTSVEVDVMSLMFPQIKKYRFGKVLVYPIGSGYKKSFRIIPYFIIAIIKGIQLQRKNKYDGVLCFWYRECALIGKFLSRFFNIKLQVWMLGQDVKTDNKYVPLLKLPENEIIMMSEHQKMIFKENFHLDIKTIANVAIDRNRFPKLNQNERPITILGVGNLSILKNYSLFVDIIDELKKENPSIKAMICGGDSGEKKNLEEKIIALDLTENITLTGSISHKEVLNYMNNAVVFLHTSMFEGGGTVLQEALYSGCHVISTIPMEDSKSLETFFYNEDKLALIQRIISVLNKPLCAQRVEQFKMEGTIQTVYDAFYK
ncbi:glycosyltransferase family 4 protein [Flavobacterium sp.]|uniref:glycosyltransferase family 4 protein n=1 Tax=Flavobacterium sp. TaxID=239 RepID=UPI002606DC50|nr:glycosyltransferase family 4 protein [Flavobacterium sp.]